MSRRVVRREIWKLANDKRGRFGDVLLIIAAVLLLVWLLQKIAG